MHNSFNTTIRCLVLPHIAAHLPSKSININDLNLPTNIQLADDLFFKPGNIDPVIGAAVFWDLLKPERIPLRRSLPTLQNTALGSIVCGSFHLPISKHTAISILSHP